MQDYAYNKNWQPVIDNFKKALGNAHVTTDEIGIRIVFQLNNSRTKEQLDLFGNQAFAKQVKYSTDAGKKKIVHSSDELGDIRVTIPYLNNRVSQVKIVAEYMVKDADIRRVENEDGTIVRRIGTWEKEYELEAATGVPWNEVTHSPYGTTVLEPQLEKPVKPDERNKQEFGIGLGVLPGNSTTRVQIEEWLNKQNEVEAQLDLPPHTAIPKEWASLEHMGRLQTAPSTIRAGLKKVFSRE